jgi:hypothetical protein
MKFASSRGLGRSWIVDRDALATFVGLNPFPVIDGLSAAQCTDSVIAETLRTTLAHGVEHASIVLA